MKKLLLSSFLMLVVSGSLMAQNKKTKKHSLQTPKTERVSHENSMIARKKAKKAEAAEARNTATLKAEQIPAATQKTQAVKN